MKVVLHMVGGDTHSGRGLDSTVRRVWGRKAQVHRHQDPNAPHYGYVVIPVEGGYSVQAEIARVEQDTTATSTDSTTTGIEAVRDRALAEAHEGGAGETGARRIEQAYQLGVADALTWVLQDGEYSRPLVELLEREAQA